MSRGDCKSCDQDVFWARTETGRPVLLNNEIDHERGNMLVVGLVGDSPRDKGHLVVRVLTSDEVGQPDLLGMPRYLVHFATCPASREWSGSKRG